MRRIGKHVRLLTTALLLLGIGAGAAGADTAELREGIEASSALMQEALQDGDAEKLVSFYTDDAALIGFGQAPIRGRAQILGHTEYLIQRGLVHMETWIDEVLGEGDRAIEIGTASFYTRTEKIYGEIRYITIWNREGDTWRIHRAFSTLTS